MFARRSAEVRCEWTHWLQAAEKITDAAAGAGTDQNSGERLARLGATQAAPSVTTLGWTTMRWL